MSIDEFKVYLAIHVCEKKEQKKQKMSRKIFYLINFVFVVKFT